MAEPLKNQFGPDIPARIAADICAVHPSFPAESFIAQSLDGFEALELMDRSKQIAKSLADYLPANREEALRILIASLGPASSSTENGGMAGFYYMPHAHFVASEGLEHFELAMEANYQITKRFTAEFSVRPYLEHHMPATLELFRRWATDPSEHVRRLVSEGSRPRLPWAGRLKNFQEDPSPVIELLTLLKDDPSEYVRRSVANNLNDIAKDHPDVVIELAQQWWEDGSDARRRMIRHGLRTLVKQADPAALAVMGFSPNAGAILADVSIEPASAAIGSSVRITAQISNPTDFEVGVLVDFRIHFMKANGVTSAKVFKGAERLVAAGGEITVSKSISLKQHTTRTHYTGAHSVEVILNGVHHPGGAFEVH
ncbi:MAG: DNA alkylation repair protein [Acidimicrobiales bacterium]|nr:DNA alkylation repair protein [Acidimicrobiales bacterium]